MKFPSEESLLSELPPEVAEEVEALREEARLAEEARMEKVRTFGMAVWKQIEEDVRARDGSGIEERWREDLQHYYGNDQITRAYRNMVDNAAEGVRNGNRQTETATRSKVFVNITRPKTNAAESRLTDMILPVDEKNWGIKPTPEPELSKQTQDGTILTQGGQDIMQPNGQPLTVGAEAARVIEEARQKSSNMERLIDDQLTECDYNGELRKMLHDAAVLGTGVVKGPFVIARNRRHWSEVNGEWKLEEWTDYVPASERVDPWNFYPDAACNGDIRVARRVSEKKLLNAKQMRALLDQPGVIRELLLECLEEGPGVGGKVSRNNRRFVDGTYDPADNELFEVFEWHGEVTKGDLEAAGVPGCRCDDKDQEYEAMSATVLMCKGKAIKVARPPLDMDTVPYDVFQWERIHGQIFGVGVPFMMRYPQRVLNAAWRMIMDNSAVAAGGQLIINEDIVEPADGDWAFAGFKIWKMKDGERNVNEAFGLHQFDTRMVEFEKIIQLAMRFAEDETSLPALMEGNKGSAPETVGGMTLLLNSANTVLRRLVKQFDDQITKPHLRRYYDHNMEYADDPNVKGDFEVDARGTSALMIRDLEKQALMGAMTWAVHPKFDRFHKVGGYSILRKMYEANKITPDDVIVGEEEAERILAEQAQQAQQQQPQDPRIVAAQINAQLKQAELQQNAAIEQARMQHEQAMKQMDFQMKLLDYAERRKESLEKVKAQLANTVIKDRAEDARFNKEANLKLATGSGI